MHTTELVFTYDDPAVASLVAASVGQEVGEIQGDRTAASLARTEREVRVELSADDLVALRAGLNTWTSLVEVAEEAVAVGQSA